MSNRLKRQIRLAHRTSTSPIYNETAPGLTEVVKVVADLNTAFQAFKSQNDEHLKALAKGKDDVVSREHVDRINNDVGKHASALEELQRKIAALSVSGGNSEDQASPEKRAYRSAFNNFVRKGNENGLHDLAVKAALTTDSNPDGGYTVPEETDAAISRALQVVSAIRRVARVIPIGASTFKALHNKGGAGKGWVGEQGSRSETTTPTLSELNYPTLEMYAMPAATQTLLDDSRLNIDGWLGDEVQIAFAELENAAFVAGDGVNKPKGFTAYTNVANASWAWGKVGYTATGASGDFVSTSTTANAYDNLVDLYHSLRSGYRQNAVWMMNDATLAKIRKVKDTIGDYIYLPPTASEPGSILGKSVEIEDNMDSFGANKYPIAFADWQRFYYVIDRMGVRVLRDPYSSKPYILFYTTKRVGGGIRDFEAGKLLKAAAS